MSDPLNELMQNSILTATGCGKYKLPSEALPCPFCGKYPLKIPFMNGIACMNKKCPVRPSTFNKNYRVFGLAIKAWNRRSENE